MSQRVFIVDDHPMFRAGVRISLDDTEGLEVVGEVATGEEAVRLVRSGGVIADVVLMDMQLPGCSGIEATRAIVADRPPGITVPRVLMMSVAEDDDVVVSALRAGAHGYLVKGAPREELIRAVRTAADGGAVFSPAVAARLGMYFSAVHELPSRAAFPQLTDRERQVLDLLARGNSNRRIARELVLSEKTVRNHVSNIFGKLQVTDRVSAVVRARDAGLGG